MLESATAITTRRSSGVCICEILCIVSAHVPLTKSSEKRERETESERDAEICLKEKSLKQRVAIAAGNRKGVRECVCVCVCFAISPYSVQVLPSNSNKNNKNSSKIKLNRARIIFMTVVNCSQS